jgi:hypothetical protein
MRFDVVRFKTYRSQAMLLPNVMERKARPLGGR